jgi:peptidoglycan/LPS O-acetylase OafA/YrhL
MVVPTWNHLWFLPYLWLYALAAPLLGWLQRRPPLNLPLWAWCLLPALPLVLLRCFVFPHFPSTHDVFHDLYNHLQYAWLFLCGWVSRGPLAQGFWAAAQQARWPMLLAVLTAWVLLLSYFATFMSGEPPAAFRMAQRVLWALMGWWAIVAACGWMQRYFQEDRPWLRAASQAVFCLYVLHQTVIVVLSQWLKPFALPWTLEAPLLVLLTFSLSLAAYLLLRRVPGLRLGFGIAQPRSSRLSGSTPGG